MEYLAIALGGALGAVARFALSSHAGLSLRHVSGECHWVVYHGCLCCFDCGALKVPRLLERVYYGWLFRGLHHILNFLFRWFKFVAQWPGKHCHYVFYY